MKIAYVTAGAGGTYCGSCLRDNTLATALMDAGHDVLLIPTYTPTRTDERNVSYNRVFLGGINVYLQQHFGFFRNTPWILDRLWDLPSILRFTTRWGVSVDPAHLGRLTVSMLRGTDGFQRKEILKLVRFLAREVAPEIINLPNSLLISLAPAIKAEWNVPVCCTLQGEEIFLDGLGEPYRSESIRLIREHATHVDAFIAVSNFGAQHMAEYLGIERSRIRVAPLGINFEGYMRPSGTDPDPFTIGYLARVTPEKGLHVLCESYQRLRMKDGLPPSRLWAAGYLAPEHRSYLTGIRKNLDSWGLSGQFHYHGELNRREKLAFLMNLSVLSVPGPYDDPKGLFLLEAMAGGIPVVQPRRGAFTEIVHTTGGGILVEPDNPDALAEGILGLWRSPERRRELGSLAYEGVRTHYSAARMAARVLEIYQSLVSDSATEIRCLSPNFLERHGARGSKPDQRVSDAHRTAASAVGS
jgi:glycosyltransferase involved in cell wall biosynthesis